jgi:hypothetical protein
METISCQEKFTVDFLEKFDKRGIIIDNPSMVESAREIDRLKTIVHFHLRFPRNGTTERADAWERQYENWWVKHFGYYTAMVGNGWLCKSGEAIEKLAIVDLGRNTELLV